MWTKIDYGSLMHDALRRLMADVLTRVSDDGLPGEHHFYITFDTSHPGVDIADWLKARYPGDMTIVIQNWFDNLAVLPDRFTITLNFGNSPEPLVIPFDAVKTFVDPSVEFGLRFDAVEGQEIEDGMEDLSEAEEEDTPADAGADVVRLDTFRKT